MSQFVKELIARVGYIMLGHVHFSPGQYSQLSSGSSPTTGDCHKYVSDFQFDFFLVVMQKIITRLNTSVSCVQRIPGNVIVN